MSNPQPLASLTILIQITDSDPPDERKAKSQRMAVLSSILAMTDKEVAEMAGADEPEPIPTKHNLRLD